MSQRSRDCSRCVIIRFGLKLGVFLVVWGCQVASGGPNLLLEFTILAATFCVVLALQAHELPFSRSLNHWDEALVFGLVSHFGKGILRLG